MSNPDTSLRPLFIYGTLLAPPLLAWALTGDSRLTTLVTPLIHPGTILGYARYSLHNRDYSAIIPFPTSILHGCLLMPLTSSQRRKLDDFEGETYKSTAVFVTLFGEDGEEREAVEADVYVWDGEREEVNVGVEWDLEWFMRERLEDWVELFGGMELVGEEG